MQKTVIQKDLRLLSGILLKLTLIYLPQNRHLSIHYLLVLYYSSKILLSKHILTVNSNLKKEI